VEWVLLLLPAVQDLPGVGLNKKVTFAKGSRSVPKSVIFVAMEMTVKSPIHQYHLSRTWERNGQVKALTSLVTDAFMN
jgi:hypothetical protein